MLHVILQILAVIGIILLCILGILLLLILLVLFVPVRYRVTGHKKGEDLQLHVKATYLLHMLSAKFSYPNPGNLIVRLFGIKIYNSCKAEVAEDGAESLIKEKQSAKRTDSEAGTNKESETAISEAQGSEMPLSETTASDGFSDEVTDEQNTLHEKKSILQKIKYTFRSICDKIKNIIEKIKNIFSNIAYYKDVITNIENQRLYSRLLKRIVKVLKSIRPRVIKADLRLGTGSPDTTAYIYGIYGMLMPVFGKNVKNINIDLDFEEAVYEGDIFLKGKITGFTLLVQAIKIIADKQLHVFIEQLKGRK